MASRACSTAARLPRSMYIVPTKVHSQPMTGQSRISALATNVAGKVASTTKMSSHEMWFRTNMQRGGSRGGSFVSRNDTASMPKSLRDHRRFSASRAAWDRRGKRSPAISRPRTRCTQRQASRQSRRHTDVLLGAKAASALEVVAEMAPVLREDLVAAQPVVLAAARRDLERAHQRGKLTDAAPVV